MIDEDWRPFCEIWITANTASANAKQLSEPVCRYAFEMLQDYPLPEVVSAVMRHGKSSKFAPTPCEIIELITGGNMHISADEAWAIVLESFDENKTVIMTREMLEAKAIVQEIYDERDMIGARMGFRAAYERIIKNSFAPVWAVSEGYDPLQRIEAVKRGIEQGRLPRGSEQKFLHCDPVRSPIAGLLTGNVSEFPRNREFYKKRWGSMKNVIENSDVTEIPEGQKLG